MGKCINHPDRETSYMCMKHNKYMCEECLKCPDPEIHCKFRPSCPIWFIDKRGGKSIDDKKSEEKEFTVIFNPGNREALVAKGSTLLEAAEKADVSLNASCNGKGVCGKCRLILESGKTESPPSPLLSDEEKAKNYVLACQARVKSDVTVTIPEETLEKRLRIAGMGKDVTAQLKGLVTEISPMLMNIPLELKPPTLDDSISEALEGANAHQDQIENIAISGNTTMAHLLLKIEPRNIRREPYIPSVSAFPIMKADNIGLKANPIAAVFVMPGPASYVGGDIVSGLIYTGFHREEPITLFIDVGTNGEIVLGNKEWLMTASCSAGPAFEGGGVRWGMRAEEGAVEKVSIDPDTLAPTVTVVDDVLPRGVCRVYGPFKPGRDGLFNGRTNYYHGRIWAVS